ncbi:MAG: hypothetical protein AAGA83_02135 [Cyanobacteria bacterium P01_F01_bin.116]
MGKAFELLALIRAGDADWEVRCENPNRLIEMISEREVNRMRREKLAKYLTDLEAHLLLWKAKYKFGCQIISSEL